MGRWTMLLGILIAGCGGTVSTETEALPGRDVATPDAGERADAAPPWQLACFDGGGTVASDERSRRCQPMGERPDWCASCAGVFAYSCWDDLPPAGDCARGGAGVFCCASNVCTVVEPTRDCPGQEQVLCSGAAPRAGCTQRSADGPLAEFCCAAP